MTEEEKAAKAAAARESVERTQARNAKADPDPEPEPEEEAPVIEATKSGPVKVKELGPKDIAFTMPEEVNYAKDIPGFRTMLLVRPECSVDESREFGGRVFTESSTGPCQQSLRMNPGKVFNWWKSCTHGPERDQKGQVIPQYLRPYFSAGVKVKHSPRILEDGTVDGTVQTRTWEVRPRLYKAAMDKDMTVMSGESVPYAIQRGAIFATEFGIEGYCELANCWQKARPKPFLNGSYCSEYHAKLVRACDNRTVLAVGGWDQDLVAHPSSEKRQEQFEALVV